MEQKITFSVSPTPTPHIFKIISIIIWCSKNKTMFPVTQPSLFVWNILSCWEETMFPVTQSALFVWHPDSFINWYNHKPCSLLLWLGCNSDVGHQVSLSHTTSTVASHDKYTLLCVLGKHIYNLNWIHSFLPLMNEQSIQCSSPEFPGCFSHKIPGYLQVLSRSKKSFSRLYHVDNFGTKRKSLV